MSELVLEGTAPAVVLDASAPDPTLDKATIHEAVVNMDRPRFDLEDLSWGESMALATFQSRAQTLVKHAQEEETALGPNPTDKDTEAVQLRLVEQLNGLMDEVKGYLAKTVTYVPRAYLVRSAPELIDWTQPDSVPKYVKTTKIALLINALSNATNRPDPLDSTPA